MCSLQEAPQTHWHYVHGLSLSSFLKKKKKLIDRSQPQWCFRASLSLLGTDWPLGIIKDGKWGEGGRWGEEGGGCSSSTGCGSSSHTPLPPRHFWPFTQEPAGVGRDLIEQLSQMYLGFGWRNRMQKWEKRSGGRGGDKKKKRSQQLWMTFKGWLLGSSQAFAWLQLTWGQWYCQGCPFPDTGTSTTAALLSWLPPSPSQCSRHWVSQSGHLYHSGQCHKNRRGPS